MENTTTCTEENPLVARTPFDPIIRGPSKYDFLQSLGSRNKTQLVTFEISRNGKTLQIGAEISAIMKTGGSEDGEGHDWSFLINSAIINTPSDHVIMPNSLIGQYSTKTGTGRLAEINCRCVLAVQAAFFHPTPREELRKLGYSLPPLL